MKRIGICCSTWNPPHVGDCRMVQSAFSALSLDEIYVIPEPENAKLCAETQHRLQMLWLCFSEDPRVVITKEEEADRLSCVKSAAKKIAQECPETEIVYFLGVADFLSYGSRWLETTVPLAVIGQPDNRDRAAFEELRLRFEVAGVLLHYVDEKLECVSSADILRMLTFRCADEYLPPKVAGYIQWHGLYDTQKNLRHLQPDALESAVISLLKPNRVKHVLGCRDTAIQLARHWGADETDAARAGLLHDVTKALDAPKQLTLCYSYGIVLDDFSKKYPKTLHALTGALIAQRLFGENEAVVSAIRWHTTGKANMTLLEKIIYVADYMEPNRDFPGVEQLRRLAFEDLDGALKLGLEMTIAVLKEQGSEISPASQEALQWLI